jgi:hypothetical protein
MRRTSRHTFVSLLIAAGTLLALGEVTNMHVLGGNDAEAVIGRPLTPMSYAGVARRTTRRAAYAGAYGYGYGYSYAPPVVSTTAVVTTLPAGCVRGTTYYDCGGAHYAPHYHGGTVVYRSL